MPMKLMTKAIEKRFAEVGRQENVKDPIIVAKFFYPRGAGTWYATEYDPENRIFFGYVTGLGFDELGSFSLDEFEQYRDSWGLGIERDLYWKEKPLSEVM
jgi:hypothetical protein